MPVEKALADLIKISRSTGKDTTLVQGGGGNTSVKTADGKYMYIKASGTALKAMDERHGWRRLDLALVWSIMQDPMLDKMDTTDRENEIVHRLQLACDDDVQSQARPSVESHLHAILDTCVIHLHPWAIGAYVNARDGQRRLERLFAREKYPPLWISYTDPGYSLAQRVCRLVSHYEADHGRKPGIMFLEKHGLFVSAATPAAALRLVRRVNDACQGRIKARKPRRAAAPDPAEIRHTQLALRQAYFEATGRYTNVNFATNEIIQAFVARPDAARLLGTPALTPDELVYAAGTPLWLPTVEPRKVADKLATRLAKGDKPAAAYLVKGLGMFIAADADTAGVVEQVSTGSLYIRAAAAGMGGIKALTRRQQDFINNWESESFRKQLVAGTAQGVLTDRIAVVTGAGSGLGRSVALGLARAGASVAVADIDLQAAEETVDLIAAECGPTRALAVACNVTDETSVDEAFGRLVDTWGGLDILVNAAGVAPAYALVDLPVDKWRFALEVNLTGYFLMARAAARIMKQQGIGGNIVNISSKSGLDASKNNTPYNATKAGELHMTRGWAMELGADGIRVNSLCPGNVFEGSKIWNPEYIRVCAKKYGIKPEEVIPYYVHTTILRREIKGQDSAAGVVFLASDQARTITGQTLVVDSGQVMVR